MRDTLTIDSEKVARADIVADVFDKVAGAIGSASAEQWAEGLRWYADAYAYAAEIGSALGLTDQAKAIAAGADIVAILSPACSWEHNVAVAFDVALGLDQSDIVYQGYASNLAKAIGYRNRIVAGDVWAEVRADLLRGPKVNPFADAIRSPWEPTNLPVIDRHMVTLCGWRRPKSLENAGVMGAVQEGVSLAAAFFGILPIQAQAIAWLTVRPDPAGDDDDLPTPF